jgi:hypothetical protein
MVVERQSSVLKELLESDTPELEKMEEILT